MAFSRNTIKNSIRTLGAVAIRTLADRIARRLGIALPSTTEAARTLVEQSGGNSIPPVRTTPPAAASGGSGGGGFRTRPAPASPGGADPSGLAGGIFRTQAEPPRPGEQSPLSEEILTPQSSNVFAFQYDYSKSMLLVTYKAAAINSGSVIRGVVAGTGRRRGGRDQLLGERGKTVKGKTNERARYGCFDVHVGVFERMKLANSKGKFVWDELRIRGNLWGHRYRYALVQGQVTPSVGGVYIPRKATPKGFRTRSIADLGSGGQRGFQTSTLPQQNGFRTRSAPRRRSR